MEKPPFPDPYPLQDRESSKLMGAVLREYAEKIESGELCILRGTTSTHPDTVDFGGAPIITGIRLTADLYLVFGEQGAK